MGRVDPHGSAESPHHSYHARSARYLFFLLRAAVHRRAPATVRAGCARALLSRLRSSDGALACRSPPRCAVGRAIPRCRARSAELGSAHCQPLRIDWNEACLRFHTTRRPVRTASAIQVRRAAHTEAFGRWRRFERWLWAAAAGTGGRRSRAHLNSEVPARAGSRALVGTPTEVLSGFFHSIKNFTPPVCLKPRQVSALPVWHINCFPPLDF